MADIKKYKLVIFDWDGTLMNSEKRIVASIQEAARRCDLPVLSYDESKQIIGLSLENAISALYPDADVDKVAQMARAYSDNFLLESEVEMDAFEGAEKLLNALKESGAKLAIATGKSRRGLDQILSECGFGQYFDMTRTPVESASKPDPLMLHQILEALEVSVEHAIMVGDTSFDLQMAQNINMDSIALSHGVHDLEHLQTFGPVASFDHLSELESWILSRLH